MRKRIALPFLLFGLLIFSFAEAQVKIGDNPQVIDPASVLELESSDKVLVITRVDSLQMTTIVPNRGALVYNTTADCVFYYDGAKWINMCGSNDTGTDGPLTADPIVNDVSTIVITPTGTGNNLEIAPNSINSEQIINGGVNGVDIQDGSIGQGKLQDNSVTQDKLSENSVGAEAIDNDNVDLGDFTNNAGFITSANIISGDANNAITSGSDNGAFYNDTGILAQIDANSSAIAADGDTNSGNEIQNLTGATLSPTTNILTIDIENGNSTTVDLSALSGTGSDNQNLTAATLNASNILQIDIEDGNSATVDLSSLASSGGTDNQNLTAATLNASNILQIDIEDGNSATVDLSSLAGGGGTDNQNLTAATLNASNILQIDIEDGNSATVDLSSLAGGGGTDNQNLTAATLNASNILQIDIEDGNSATVDLSSLAGGGGNQNLNQVLSEGNDANASGITNLTTNGSDATAAATVGFVNAQIAAGGQPLNDGQILVGDATNNALGVTMGGDATLNNTGVLTIANDAITTDKIVDATITLGDLNANGATTDGEIMRWDTTANAGAGGWVVGPNTGHTGIANSIFFANEVDGSPTFADGELFWDPNVREENGGFFGALGIGLDGGVMSTKAKVHIAELLNGKLSYPLEIQNRTNQNGNNSAVGVLFSVDFDNAHGKGALTYERTGAWGVGDFHFLQNTVTNSTNPTLTDKSFSILSNKDIQLYGNLIARNGAATATGQVLTNTVNGTEWAAASGGLSTVTASTAFTGDGTSGNALDIADNAITTDKIMDGEVQTDDIEDFSITTTKIEPLSPTPATDQMLITNTSGDVEWAPALTSNLNNGTIFIGDATNTPQQIALNGDVTMDNLGDVTIANAVVTDAKLDKGNIPLSGFAVPTADVALGGFKITDLAVPTLDQDAATKKYVDDNIGGTPTLNNGTIFIGDAANAPQQIALNGDVTMDNLGDVTIANAVVTDAKLDKGNIPLSGFAVPTADVALGGFKITDLAAPTLDQDAATKKYVDDNAGNSLSSSNLIQTDALRTYEVGTGQELVFTGLGNIGFGNGANPPLSKFHFAGEVRVEGVNSSEGTEGTPAYSFSTADDSDTGMYRPAADQIGFSVGGFEALRIEEPTTGVTRVIVNETLELDGQILDEAGNLGTTGQVLTATATGTQWAATTSGPINVAPSTFTGDGASSQLDINNSGIVTDMLEDDSVTAAKLNADVAGNGLTQNAAGGLEVDTSVLAGPGTISGSEIIVTGGPNATFTNVFLEIGPGAITSAKIANGAVTDDAVSAGISGAKIIPDFGAQNIVTTGNLSVNGPVLVGGLPVHPDYVFQKYFLGTSELNADYRFKSLQEIEAFVKKYHHLPGIKSAATVKKEGVWNLSASNLQNLEKIEELFLHTIDQEKEINKLKSEKETLANELATIKKDLAEIKSLLKKQE